MASFNARWSGRCADCDEWFDVGELVHYVDDELVHDRCSGEELKPESPPCPQCWTVHAGECI